jgi:hypothetical protein
MNPHRRRVRMRRVCAHGTAGLIVALCAAQAASAAPIPQGRFAGTTDPHIANANDVTFRVVGQTIRDRIIYWRAACQSGSTFTYGTETPRIPVAGGAWHSGGSYDQAVPSGMTAHITILEDRARFTSPITAAGVWSVQVSVFGAGQQIDTCATGPVSWAAGNLGVAGHPSTLIVPAGDKVAGAGYAQWETRAWQWDDRNLHFFPGVISRAATRCVTAGESGPVWFLHGDTDRRWFDVRTCRLPVGRYLFLDTPSNECSTVEQPPFRASSTAGLERCAKKFRARSSLALDGKVLSPSGIAVATGVFKFRMPATDNWLGVAGSTSGRAAVSGQGVMLRPLAPGRHTLVRVIQYPGHPVEIETYELTVA